MSLVPRTGLVSVSLKIPSSYPAKGGGWIPFERAGGRLTPDAAQAVLLLYDAIAPKTPFRMRDGFRDPEQQHKARIGYLHWVSAGKPAPGSPAWTPDMKDAFVAPAGESFHNAGRAIDFDIEALTIPLKELWDVAIPLGWSPVIAAPDATMKEAWHLDFMGPWAPVKQRLGYSQAAIAACLDIGYGYGPKTEERYIQAQLHRLGQDVGPIDGVLGKRSQAALQALGVLGSNGTLVRALNAL